MTQTATDTRHIGREGRKLLEAIQGRFAKEEYGRFVAIDVDSGDYFLGETGIEATKKAQAEHPGKVFFLGRIGCRTTYTFKGRR
jgi:hypothetical protein